MNASTHLASYLSFFFSLGPHDGAHLVPGGSSPPWLMLHTSGCLDDSNPSQFDEEDQPSQTPILLSKLLCLGNGL